MDNPRVTRIHITLGNVADGGKVSVEAKKPSNDNATWDHNITSRQEAVEAVEKALDLLFAERERQLTELRDNLVAKLARAQSALLDQ